MDSLIYSLNATVPVFLVIVLGYILKRVGVLNDNFVTVSNTFNFKITLPVMVFTDMAATDIRTDFDVGLVAYSAAATLIMFLAVWGMSRLVIRDRSIIGAFAQASCRSSVAVLGIAFLMNIYGNAGAAPMIIIGAVPLFNILSVLILTFEGEGSRDSGGNLKKALKGIVTNPILMGVALGCLSGLLRIDYPPIVDKTLSLVSALATPQALICIGASFEGRKAIAKLLPTAAAACIKLLVLPGVFLTLAVLLGFRDQALTALIIMLGGPTTPSCYIMAKNMGNDEVLTSSVIVATTLLSAFTLTFWIFLARFLGLTL